LKDTFYIRLRTTTPEPASAALWSTEGGLRPLAVPASELAARAAGCRVVAFVPAADVRLASMNVAARSAQKVLQAAPYALEEQIADDVDTLHFAIGPPQAAAGYPVAVVARSRMEAWLAALTELSLRPDVLAPEHLCLPLPTENTIQLLAQPDEIVARTEPFRGFNCVPEELATYLQIADPEKLAGLRVWLAPDLTPDLSALNRPTELMPGHRSVLEILIKHWRAETSINLLQGAYSPREALNRNWAPWRLPAALAASWLALALANHAIHAWRLNHEADELDAKNTERFQSLFPEEKKIVAGHLMDQAEQKMKALRSSGASQGLLALMAPVAASLTAVPGLALQNLQFREGALYLNLTGRDLQALESLRGWFGQHPATHLEVQSANAGANGVQIRVKISAA